MKAKKLMGMIACAGACVSLSAFANTTETWFGVTPTGSDIGVFGGTTNGVAVTVAEGVITLDNDLDSALTISPTVASPALNDGLVTITSSAALTPSDVSDLTLVPGAQAGFAVAVDSDVTNFYGYASASKNGEPAWNKLSGTVPAEGTATSFSIVLDYRTSTVQFYKGDVLLSGTTNGVETTSFAISNNFVNLNNIAAYGSGSINSITSLYEVAVAAVVSDGGATTNKYGSAVEALAKVKTDGGTVQDVNTSTGEASSAPLAGNGLYVWQCDALGIGVAKSDKVPFKSAATVNNHITLQVASEIEEGVQARFKVYTKNGENWEEGNTTYPSNAIELPTGTSGKYQIKPASFTAQ